jgi:ribosomal protein S18 acetylase RimI-like enzyme
MNIEQTLSPNDQDIKFLTKKINEETSEFGAAHPFAFFIRDEDSQMIAGANGFVIYGTIHTDQLWVAPKYRNQGLARQLMERVHKLGIKKGCTMATVCTMSFQNAINFYKKIGYNIDFERKGYVSSSKFMFLRRDF